MNTVKITITEQADKRGFDKAAHFSVIRYNGFAPDIVTEPEAKHCNIKHFIRDEKRQGKNVIVVDATLLS